jgi:colicin import membrane protein
MEANQITCPQCGLANNELAESCVQCGIIFIKNPVMSTQTIKDDEKRKAIEEAETMLDQTQAPPEIDAFKNEIVNRPDPHEDTVEIQIPKEETTDIKPEAALPEASKPEADKNSENQEIEMKATEAAKETVPEVPEPKADRNSENQEIEMEAIEAAMETVDGTVDAEGLFLSEVSTDKSAETTAPATAQKTVGTTSETENADDQSGETLEAEADKEDNQKPEADALTVDSPEENPLVEPQTEENRVEKEPVEIRSETARTAEAETTVAEVVEPAKSEGHSVPADAAPPKEQEIQIEKEPESTTAGAASTKAEEVPHPNATIEMPEELVEAAAEADEQAEKAKKDALKKQQEAQAKAEALEKEKAAQAVALKKKKLAQAQALKKQKAAQAKAEALKKKKEALAKARASKKQEETQARADALKKQKAAQAMAEASSQEIQRASGMTAADAGSMNHYERLLGLLKRYKGKAIGINYDNTSEIREAELVEANEEFFSVRVKDKKLQYSYPLKTILTIVEGQEGVETGEGDKKAKFDAVIKVYPLVLF